MLQAMFVLQFMPEYGYKQVQLNSYILENLIINGLNWLFYPFFLPPCIQYRAANAAVLTRAAAAVVHSNIASLSGPTSGTYTCESVEEWYTCSLVETWLEWALIYHLFAILTRITLWTIAHIAVNRLRTSAVIHTWRANTVIDPKLASNASKRRRTTACVWIQVIKTVATV